MLNKIRTYLHARGMRLRSVIFALLMVLALIAGHYVRKAHQSNLVTINGRTMGTRYTIKYKHPKQKHYKQAVDSILKDFSHCLSTYDPDSDISIFNERGKVRYRHPYFFPVLQSSKQVYQATGGAFDPTVGPLVEAWGFGKSERKMPDSSTVDSLLKLINFEAVQFNREKAYTGKPGVQLDFSAVAKGYGVDVIAGFLKSQDVQHMMVEIGGEVYCSGYVKDQQSWVIGITNPQTEKQKNNPVFAKVHLRNRALATSGNYYNYYVKNGRKYAHTINPATGYPVQHGLLSASVLASDCMTADAYATAFMVMGTAEARKLLDRKKQLEGYLIYNDAQGNIKTFATKGADSLFTQ